MNTIDILRDVASAPTAFVTIKPDNNSTQVKRIMGDNLLNIAFEENHYIQFKINDYCSVFGETYIINRLPLVTKVSRFLWRYTLVMEARGYDLAKAQFLFLGADNTLRESDFSLMGNADDFINLVLANINRVSSGWIKGQVILSEYKNITFSRENCYNALSRLAEEFETEFWIEGKTIHLTKRSNDTGYTFKHGRNKGLYEITRQTLNNSSIVTRLYAFGSEKNLPEAYLVTSRRLKLPAVYFLEHNTAAYGVIEHTEIFEDIFPHRTGIVTAVNGGDPFVFTDADIDFNVNDYLLPGLVAKVAFNTGQLAGYEFEVESFNNGTKIFRIQKNAEEKVLDLPSALIRPAIGDEYVLVDIYLPQSYIDAAEADLAVRANTLLNQLSEPQLAYNIVLDPVFVRRYSKLLKIGDLVWILDQELELQRKIRVISVIRNIVNEFQLQVEISDTVTAGTVQRIINAQSSTDRDVRDIDNKLVNNSILNNNVVGTLVFQNMPTTNTYTGFSEVLMEDATGKIYRKI